MTVKKGLKMINLNVCRVCGKECKILTNHLKKTQYHIRRILY